MNLLKELQDQHNLAYFMISHNLATARFISDIVAIMYLGKFAEIADSESFFGNPMHPYSQALISAALPVDLDQKHERIVLQGEVPSPINPPSGCRFRTRCPYVMGRLLGGRPASERGIAEPPGRLSPVLAPGFPLHCVAAIASRFAALPFRPRRVAAYPLR